MNFVYSILLLATALLAFVTQSEAAKVRINWSPSKGVRVALPKGRGYKFSGNTLQVCNGDVLNFYWSGETAGMHMFGGREFRFNGDQGRSDFNSCKVDGNINFLKTENPSGSFNTKGNREGWRFYAYIPGLGKYDTRGGKGCKLKLAVYWNKNC